MSTSLLLGWGAYARDKNTSARLCAKNAGGAYARGGACLRDTTIQKYNSGMQDKYQQRAMQHVLHLQFLLNMYLPNALIHTASSGEESMPVLFTRH